jgi:hypothetical protein
MCPACLTTATLAVAGATSAGGLAALALKMLHARSGAPAPAAQPQETRDGTTPDRAEK